MICPPTLPTPLQALDKMEKEWASIVFNVLPYKDTDTYILKSPDEASQLLDDHIVMTQSMSFSPYKKPFEQRINSWETKLKLTQVGPLAPAGVLSLRQHVGGWVGKWAHLPVSSSSRCLIAPPFCREPWAETVHLGRARYWWEAGSVRLPPSLLHESC